MKKCIKIIVLIFVAWFSMHCTIAITDGLVDEEGKSDVGVIFGNTVNPDGSLSARLKARLDKGVELYKNGRVPLLIVSGGLGKEGHYEGTKMHAYLIQKNIPDSCIIKDNKGNTTSATSENFKKMNLKAESITVITQYHHITRAKLAFKKFGFENVKGVHADYFEMKDFLAVIREFVAYYQYLFFY
ncbi:MAG: YdcF family protein [Flavobacteriales bacterium]